MLPNIIRGSILNPRAPGRVDYIHDGVIAADDRGQIAYVGEWPEFLRRDPGHPQVASAGCIICPPFLDAHIHIPQHPIRGKFLDGVEDAPPAGRLIAGLNRNVFPAEERFADENYARNVCEQFLADTLAHGVIGGAAYATVHARATEQALALLPETWFVGLVLMCRNCPEYLRNDEEHLERDLMHLAERFGRRMILTDRFAVAVDSKTRVRALAATQRFDLFAQTHLNEQREEKRLVEQELYPDARSYTHVYARDGLLDRFAILAHCVHTRDDEFELIRSHGSAIAHCPTSNTLLGSGIMPLDRVLEHGIDYAICTDVGASPTTSLLAEMAQFLKVHEARSRHATPAEALYRVTLAPAKMLRLSDRAGSFEVGKDLSFIEIAAMPSARSADEVIRRDILEMDSDVQLEEQLDRLESGTLTRQDLLELTQDVHRTAKRLDRKVSRVVLRGQTVFNRPDARTEV